MFEGVDAHQSEKDEGQRLAEEARFRQWKEVAGVPMRIHPGATCRFHQ
jgi:hypothetical protein